MTLKERVKAMASEMIYSTGERVPVVPANGKFWTLGELQAKVGGYIEIARTTDNRFMVTNEEGLRLELPYNPVATKLYIFGEASKVVGNVVIVDTKYELDGPDEDEE
jgi:hypothetical protein